MTTGVDFTSALSDGILWGFWLCFAGWLLTHHVSMATPLLTSLYEAVESAYLSRMHTTVHTESLPSWTWR